MKVYGLICPISGELRYIGKTSRALTRRLEEHLNPSKLVAKNYKNCWIKSLKAKGQKPEIIKIQELQKLKDLHEAEIYWIKFFKEIGCNLVNSTDGGDGASPGKDFKSLEARKRISQSVKKRLSKPVIEATTGVVFSSGREAERQLGLYENAVLRVLTGKQKQAAGYIFRRVENGW